MESIRAIFFKPDPAAQMRKCNALIRQNTRKLDRDLADLKALESKTKQFIVNASKRGQRNPSQATQAAKDMRIFGRELVRVRKQHSRLNTSRAQLESVRMQVNEAFSVRKIEGSLRSSTGIMKDVNTLVRLPQLEGTMRQLSLELVKAGIIEESVDDAMPEEMLMEDEEEAADAEVDKVLQEILHGRLAKAGELKEEKPLEEPEEEEFEDQEATLAEMRGRLEALKS